MRYAPSINIIYSRYLQKGKVLRVARMDPIKGLVLALYPTDNPDLFQTEAFHDVNDESPERAINKGEINDEIWLRLLGGEPRGKILADYHSDGRDSGFYEKKENELDVLKIRGFTISDDKDEDEILQEREIKFASS